MVFFWEPDITMGIKRGPKMFKDEDVYHSGTETYSKKKRNI